MALASAYAEAARGVLAHQQDTSNLPYFALVAHGFELAFKAVLILRGWDEERLMLIGHDIARCRDAAQSMSDEPIDTDTEAVVESLSSPHAMQGFRYPQPIANALPDRELAVACLERLLRNVAPVNAYTNRAETGSHWAVATPEPAPHIGAGEKDNGRHAG
jgi:hypothetical protein